MSSTMGNKIKISIFGQSHGEAIGVVIDGLPCGEAVDFDEILAYMMRRAPGNTPTASARKEADFPHIVSGIVNGKTCGAPLCAIIQNSDAHAKDYSALLNTPRPSHADFTAFAKFGEDCDMRGGGHFSGRLTAPLCFAGAVCGQILARRGIFFGAHISQIGGICDIPFDAVNCTREQILAPASQDFPVVCAEKGEKMRKLILETAACGNSIGGVIECAVVGVPSGIGQPMFDGLENLISRAVFAIPGVRGIEFGAGFAAADMLGSQHNDSFIAENGKIRTATNNHGGILGGISSGMPIIFRAAIKPTPSIALAQKTVDLRTNSATEIKISGRHDPCIVPRAVPCIEAAACLALADLIL